MIWLSYLNLLGLAALLLLAFMFSLSFRESIRLDILSSSIPRNGQVSPGSSIIFPHDPSCHVQNKVTRCVMWGNEMDRGPRYPHARPSAVLLG